MHLSILTIHPSTKLCSYLFVCASRHLSIYYLYIYNHLENYLCRSIQHLIACQSLPLSTFPSFCVFFLCCSFFLSLQPIWLFTHLSTYVSTYLSKLSPRAISLLICLPACLPIYMSFYLAIGLSIHRPFIHLSSNLAAYHKICLSDFSINKPSAKGLCTHHFSKPTFGASQRKKTEWRTRLHLFIGWKFDLQTSISNLHPLSTNLNDHGKVHLSSTTSLDFKMFPE